MTETGGEGHVRQLEEDGRVSETVLRAIATVSNRPLLELPPLQESIDADAVDGMFESPTRGCSLRFEYAEYDVTVEPERVHVRERR